MRLLIDENIPQVFADWLRAAGNDLILAGELAAGETDSHWLELAEKNRRIIMTADKDFGELIFRDRLNSNGVILLRLSEKPLTDRLLRLQEVWSVVEANPAVGSSW